MNRNTGIGIAVIVLLVVGGLVYVVPALLPQDDNVMTVTFYDADDNIVDSVSTEPSFWDWSFVDPTGSEVSKVVVTVDYDTAITGEGNPTDLNVECDLTWTVRLNTQTAGIVNGPHTDTDSLSTTTGTFVFTFYLSSMITPIDSMGETYGWSITFEADLTGSVNIDGEPVDATPWSNKVNAQISWNEADASMSFIDAYVGAVIEV